jgi:hypothetical protein
VNGCARQSNLRLATGETARSAAMPANLIAAGTIEVLMMRDALTRGQWLRLVNIEGLAASLRPSGPGQGDPWRRRF